MDESDASGLTPVLLAILSSRWNTLKLLLAGGAVVDEVTTISGCAVVRCGACGGKQVVSVRPGASKKAN